MENHRFWSTQPVPQYGDQEPLSEGAILSDDELTVSPSQLPLYEGFEWTSLDMTNPTVVQEIYDLLFHHYVEDRKGQFRLDCSSAFLSWALQPPNWRKDWHLGVRATKSRKLAAFISATPATLRIRNTVFKSAEVSFICIHKKLRSKRLAPVLIKELTRRCYEAGYRHGVFTSSTALPTPISTCRYYHRSLNWKKLSDAGFTFLPIGATVEGQIANYRLPNAPLLKGVRPIEAKDIPHVAILLRRYLKRFDFVQEFDNGELKHWLVPSTTSQGGEQNVWTYVVVDLSTKRITDFFSFHCVNNSALRSSATHKTIKGAQLFYYATDKGLKKYKDDSVLKKRLNELIHDALILAAKAGFDVFNALSNFDNPLFLKDQLFLPGNGMLNYYLYNYGCKEIAGGLNLKGEADENYMGGNGLSVL